MRRILSAFIALFCSLAASGQRTITYSYDDAGNRTFRSESRTLAQNAPDARPRQTPDNVKKKNPSRPAADNKQLALSEGRKKQKKQKSNETSGS